MYKLVSAWFSSKMHDVVGVKFKRGVALSLFWKLDSSFRFVVLRSFYEARTVRSLVFVDFSVGGKC
jgi:hypothetical protein